VHSRGSDQRRYPARHKIGGDQSIAQLATVRENSGRRDSRSCRSSEHRNNQTASGPSRVRGSDLGFSRIDRECSCATMCSLAAAKQAERYRLSKSCESKDYAATVSDARSRSIVILHRPRSLPSGSIADREVCSEYRPTITAETVAVAIDPTQIVNK